MIEELDIMLDGLKVTQEVGNDEGVEEEDEVGQPYVFVSDLVIQEGARESSGILLGGRIKSMP